MKAIGRTTPENSEDHGRRLIAVTEEEYMAFCELAAAVSEDEEGWNISRGFVEKWSGKEVNLAPALKLIIKFAKNIKLLWEVIEDLQEFKNKWVEDAIQKRKEVGKVS